MEFDKLTQVHIDPLSSKEKENHPEMAEEELTLLKSEENKSCSTKGSPSQSSETPKVDTKHLRKWGRRKRNPPSYAMEHAEKLRANLDPKTPTFIKYMLPTCVSTCFWLGFTREFGKLYLPKSDRTMILITEDGKEYPVKYVSERAILSAGWRGFSNLHNLVEGDVLVFHLIEATKFKVYIIRKNALAEDDDTLPIFQVDTEHLGMSGSRKRHPPQMQSYAIRQAEKLRDNLDPKIPTFIKYMLPTCISTSFTLGFTREFGRSYLPKSDKTISLITEDGKEYPVNYIAGRAILSGGWKDFSILHKLVEGDVLVFHLIEATKFKVYIIRENALAEDDDTLPIIDSCPPERQTDPGNIINTHEFQCNPISPPAPKKLKPVPASNLDECWSTGPTISCQTGNNNKEVDVVVKEDIRFSKSLEFKDVNALENFTVMVNGLVIDSEIPKDVMTKYYDLCRSQNGFLHDHLPKAVSSKLVAAIISEIVNIADAIAASKLTTSEKEFTIWSKSLDAIQQIGMNVGFLHSRLQRLMYLASESKH